MQQGIGLSWITQHIAHQLKVNSRIIPASEQAVPTMLRTELGWLHVQSYLVEHQCQLQVNAIQYRGAEIAEISNGVKTAISESDLVIFAPSNPLLSIQPILALNGMTECLKHSSALKLAISPLIAEKAMKGPTQRLMEELGFVCSAVTVAAWYREWIDIFVIDPQDEALCEPIRALGLNCVQLPIIMHTLEQKKNLAIALSALLT